MARITYRRKPAATDGSKRCTTCQLTKHVSEFRKNPRLSQGRHIYCKECEYILGLLPRYGLTREAYFSLVARANGRCECCRQELQGGRENAIDHDPHTGKVRGLLCRACNLLLGHGKHDPQTLRNALEYIQRHC